MEEDIQIYGLLPGSIIPPEDQVVDYAYSLVDDIDFGNEGYGLIVLNAINSFLVHYPNEPSLLKIKATCFRLLGHESFFNSLFSKNGDSNEAWHISEMQNHILQYKNHPELAINFCSYLYSRCFTSIVSNCIMQKEFVEIMSDLLDEIPDNIDIQYYYAKGILSICELTNRVDVVEKYTLILDALAKKYPDNENVVMAYASAILLTLHYRDEIEQKRQLFDEINRLVKLFLDFKNLLSIKIFALISLIIEDVGNREKYVSELNEISQEKETITELLDKFEWNTAFEHFSGLNKNKMNYCKNMQKIATLFPDFPDFILVHRKKIIALIAENGKAYYRNDCLQIIQNAAERFPEKENIQLLYAEALMWIAYYGDQDRRYQYMSELKNLSDKYPDNLNFLAFYSYPIGKFLAFRNEDDYKTYLPVIEDIYRRYPGHEFVCESFVQSVVWLVREDLFNKEKNERKFSKTGDAEKYFPQIQKIAREYSQNNTIIEYYTSALDTYYEFLPDKKSKKEAVEAAIRASTRDNIWWSDIACNSYHIIEEYYIETEDPSEKQHCFQEMVRIACDESDGEDHKWYIMQTFDDIINTQKTEEEKEPYRHLMKQFCLEYPNSMNSAWHYGRQLIEKMQTKTSVEEKQVIFDELKQWTLQFPGNYLLLQEYAIGLFEMACALLDKEPENYYAGQFRDFVKNYPVVVYKTKLADNEQYKKIVTQEKIELF